MAGRHVVEMSRRTFWIAEIVKGLLMSSRLSLVMCALSRVALSRSTWRGFGGFGGRLVEDASGVFGERELRYWPTSACCVDARLIKPSNSSCRVILTLASLCSRDDRRICEVAKKLILSSSSSFGRVGVEKPERHARQIIYQYPVHQGHLEHLHPLVT